MTQDLFPTVRETWKVVFDDWKKALTGSYATAALWIVAAILAILPLFVTLKSGAQFPTGPAIACGIAALLWSCVSFAVSGVNVAYRARLDLYELRTELSTERNKLNPRIKITIQRLTVSSIGRVDGLGGALILAWVSVRNDGRETPLRRWHMLIRTNGQPIGIGIDVEPGERLVEFTHTDTGGPGDELNWDYDNRIEAQTEHRAIGIGDHPEGFMLGILPADSRLTLEDIRARLYLQCQDSIPNTWNSDEIQGIHPGRVEVILQNGARKQF